METSPASPTLNQQFVYLSPDLMVRDRGRVEGSNSRGRVVVSTAAFHARVRGLVSGLGGLKETKMFLPHPPVKVSGEPSSRSFHHPQEVFLAQFSLYVHKSGIKPDSFHF